MDSKPKDFYQIEYYYRHNDYFVLIACNREKKPVCNIVDINGKIPDGFCVNWRIHNYILQELKIKFLYCRMHCVLRIYFFGV